MSSGVILAIVFLSILLFLVLLRLASRKDGKRAIRDPEAEIARIQTIKSPLRLLREFRKTSDPEIRRAAVAQLTDRDCAEMLTRLEEGSRKELLAYVDEPSRLEALRALCGGAAQSAVRARIDELQLREIEAGAAPERLAALIGGEARPFVRQKAAEKLADPALLSEAARRAASAGDEKLLELLLARLDAVGAVGAAAAIAADPALPAAIREAAVRHVWELGTLERLQALSGLAAACHRQRFEAICREGGHEWELVEDSVSERDSPRLRAEGRKLWIVPDYRCRKCGLMRMGERNKGEWILKYGG